MSFQEPWHVTAIIVWIALVFSPVKTLMLETESVVETLVDLNDLMQLSAWEDFIALLTD